MGIVFSKYRRIYCIYFTLPLCRAIHGANWTSAHFLSLLYCKYDFSPDMYGRTYRHELNEMFEQILRINY